MPEKYNKSMKLFVRDQVKTLLAQEGLKIKDLAAIIEERTGKKCSANSLSQKLSRETLTYNEILMIAELLGYEISFNKKEN